MSFPLVSVVIPFYSNKIWLQEALMSVFNQTYKNIEILVINDGSEEDVADLEEELKNKVTFFYQTNGGPSKARNTGIEKSKGKYIAFLDSDDIWMENKLEKQIYLMENNESIWSQHSYLMFWDDNTKETILNTEKYQGDVLKDCFISFKIQTSTIVVRKDILKEKGISFPLSTRYGEDMTFYKDLAKLYPLDYLDGVYSKFRMRGNNAGFRAQVQLKNRSEVWEELKTDPSTIEILPTSVINAYRIAHFNARIGDLAVRYINSDRIVESISKLLYLIPYAIFKFNSRNKVGK